MDFAFTDEQEFLQTTAEKLARDEFGSAVARAAMEGDRTRAERGWRNLVDAGWVGIRVPEEAGGSGAGLVEACIIADALASALAPVPFVGTAIAAVSLLQASGGDAAIGLLQEVAAGRQLGVALSADLTWPTTAPAVGWECGTGSALVYGSDGVAAVENQVAGSGIDPLHPLGALVESPAAVVPVGADLALAGMRIGCAAALLGTIRGAAEMAFQYVKDRKQYGQSIGSFQAVQHMCADVQVALDSCHSVVYGAAWTVDNSPLDEARRAAAVAKAWCGESVVAAAELVVQLLGGIGVTWESDAHLYLRQAHLYAGVLGDRRGVRFELGRALIGNLEATRGSA